MGQAAAVAIGLRMQGLARRLAATLTDALDPRLRRPHGHAYDLRGVTG